MLAQQPETSIKTISTAKLTFNYVQKMEREKYRALGLLLFLVIISFIWLLFQPSNSPDGIEGIIFPHTMFVLASFIGAYWCLRVAYRGYQGGSLLLARSHCLSWLLIGLGLIVNGFGDSVKGSSQLFFHTILPIPSLADLYYQVFSCLLLIGLLLQPLKPQRERGHLRLTLDGIITGLCLFGISWYVLFGTVIQQTGAFSLAHWIILLSYPDWDILLFLAFVLLIYRRAEAILRSSLLLAGLGIASLTWANANFVHLTVLGRYSTGMAMLDPFWFTGFLLLGISAIYQYNALALRAHTTSIFNSPEAQTVSPQTHQGWKIARHFLFLQHFLIYLPVIVLLLLTLYNQPAGNHNLVNFMDILCGMVIPVCITRYLIATYENDCFVREKERSHADAELLRRATASLSEVLEMDLLLNRIVAMGAAELGFDAAALVVIDEYDRPLDEQTSLQARAATPDGRQAMSWCVTGKMIPYCTALMGGEIEVFWASAPPHPLTLVHQWHVDQRVQSSLFVPLAYQGKIQGSLAFSLRAARHFTEHERYLANTFAAEVAKALEHAHFYELARENALFAQAMSNVAARLNSIVAIGMVPGNEIHQLICTEGANALSADLAILYVQNNYNQFVPLAAVISEPEPSTFPQEWPALTYDDYNMLILQPSQPALLQVMQMYPGKTEPGAFVGKVSGVAEQSVPDHFQVSRGTAGSEMPTPQVTQASVATLSQKKPMSPLTRSLSLRDALQRRCVQTALLAPLIIHQSPMGLLVLARIHRPESPPRRSFALSDLTHAQDFASQAAIAFTNAHLYQQLRTTHQRMQELDRLKDQFMITASHELRTPLTAVQGYLELLEHYHTDLPFEQQHEFVQKASRGCDELVLLLNNVMDASYLEMEAGIHPTHLVPVAVSEVIANVVDLIDPQATQEKRKIHISIPPHLIVKADPTRLRQVLRNLSVNALKYSEPGTPLFFSARPAFTHGSHIILSVTDHGKGIKPQDQSRLFQRFVRLESDLNSTVRGSGLGLYISRRLIEAMNGKIWIESTGTPGAGTTFHIQLPMV